jgi:hypothetical protein
MRAPSYQKREAFETSIVFAGEMELADKQLSLLGLKDAPKYEMRGRS